MDVFLGYMWSVFDEFYVHFGMIEKPYELRFAFDLPE